MSELNDDEFEATEDGDGSVKPGLFIHIDGGCIAPGLGGVYTAKEVALADALKRLDPSLRQVPVWRLLDQIRIARMCGLLDPAQSAER